MRSSIGPVRRIGRKGVWNGIKGDGFGSARGVGFWRKMIPISRIRYGMYVYELEWTWSEMLWLVWSHRIIEAKRTSSVSADIGGAKTWNWKQYFAP
jgi:hypothetical protein